MVTLSHMPFLLKKTNFTIAIVVFRVPLHISQSTKSSLNMMEIKHFTMWTLSWKLSQQPSSCNKKLPMEFLPRKHPPIETSSYDNYSSTRILHWCKKMSFLSQPVAICSRCSLLVLHLLFCNKSVFFNLSIYSAHFTTPSPQQNI